MANNNYSRLGFIKNIYVELPNYRYIHGPVEYDKPNNNYRFLGRKKIINRLTNILTNSGKPGAYLVTGYRGMGKTSFVNEAIRIYKKKNKKCIVVNLCLSKKNIRVEEIYHQLLSGLRNELSSNSTPSSAINNFTIVFSLVLILFSIGLGKYTELSFSDISEISFSLILTSLLVFLFISVLITILSQIIIKKLTLLFFKRQKYAHKIDWIIKRMTSQVSTQSGAQSMGNRFPLGFVDVETSNYGIASDKEIENELINLINEINRKFSGKLIFIFDELDKITDPDSDTDTNSNNSGFDTIYQKNSRSSVLDVLGSMKNFITRAPAKFIFIAGREMFNVVLADVNDRHSSISSIFNQIINVDSFLRDQSYKNSRGITNLIEEYLKSILLPDILYSEAKSNFSEKSLLKNYYEILPSIPENERKKVVFAIQNLLIYLTYRSNGSPQKLQKLTEELITNRPTSSNPWKSIIIDKEKLQLKKNKWAWIHSNKLSNRKMESLYLKISYSTQYKHSFISFLYRPFILTHSHYLKEYSDNILYTTPYLMDHLLKFHPFAFSRENLELLPEIISSSRQPSIRFFTEELIAFLSQNIVREIDSGLFEYKYFKKISNELEYISKTFEKESAAFNFTRDENFKVKLQIRKRIKELRSIFKDYIAKDLDENVYSISYLNVLLGDAHFFDHEFNEAIVVYQDSIHHLRNKSDLSWSVDDFVLFAKVILKIGLCFEKTKSYDFAYSHYAEIIEKSNLYFENYINNSEGIHMANNISFYESVVKYSLHGYLALIHIIEKRSPEGVSMTTILNFQERLLNLLNYNKKNLGAVASSRSLIWFNLNVGVLNFYKNSPYSGLLLKKYYSKAQLSYINGFRQEFYNEIKNEYSSNIKHVDFSPYSYISYCDCLRRIVNYKNKELTLGKLLKKVSLRVVQSKSIPEYDDLPDKKSVVITKDELKLIATTLTKLGDVILSYLPASRNQKILYNYESVFNKELVDDSTMDFSSEDICRNRVNDVKIHLESIEEDLDILNINTVIKIYYLASRVYAKAGIGVSSSFSFRKIIHVIRLTVDVPVESKNKSFLFIIEKLFLSRILDHTSANSSASDRPQMDKFKFFFEGDSLYHSPELTKKLYKNVSNSPEVKEALLFYAALSCKSWAFEDFNSYKEIILFGESIFDKNENQFREQSLISLNGSISSRFSRILELSLQNSMNGAILKNYISPSLKTLEAGVLYSWIKHLFYDYKSKKGEERTDFLKENLAPFFDTPRNKVDEKKALKIVLTAYSQLVCNSIYCLHEIIKTINISEVKYMLSYSYLGFFHNRMSKWLKHFSLCLELKNNNIIDYDVKNELSVLIGIDSVRILNPTSQSQQALQNFNRSLQLHQQGNTYRKQINNMTYLEDDFNDNLYHYCAAVEKQLINSGTIDHEINRLKKDIQKSQLLAADRYMSK